MTQALGNAICWMRAIRIDWSRCNLKITPLIRNYILRMHSWLRYLSLPTCALDARLRRDRIWGKKCRRQPGVNTQNKRIDRLNIFFAVRFAANEIDDQFCATIDGQAGLLTLTLRSAARHIPAFFDGTRFFCILIRRMIEASLAASVIWSWKNEVCGKNWTILDYDIYWAISKC